MVHDSIGFGLLHSFVVVTAVEIASIAQPMLTNNLLHMHEGFLKRREGRRVVS
jgi:hypothetical protein